MCVCVCERECDGEWEEGQGMSALRVVYCFVSGSQEIGQRLASYVMSEVRG